MKEERADAQAIKERVNTISVMSRYLSLTKSGSNYKGRCPFHKDDTPSFVVSAEKGLWHCFGCGEGGDLFAFLMKIERISFPEALEKLAAEAGVVLGRKVDTEKERLRAIMADAAGYFSRNLAESTAARRAREYLVERGYDERAWEQFGLGYALPGWENLKKRFLDRHGERALVNLGLLVEGAEGTYDRFRDRVIFPIHDLSGRPIAFGGRAFEGEPKYLNSPKTSLFDKGRQLYGLSWARDAIGARRAAVLVEGYTDVLSLHLSGLTHAVASMGTALTREQAELLARYAEEVVVAYDRDTAGEAASLRGMRILYESLRNVRVAVLPEGDDPDTLVRREGKERVTAILDAAVPFQTFFVDRVTRDRDLRTLSGKEGVLEEARGFASQIREPIRRQEIIAELAERLRIGEADVRSSLEGRRERESGEETAQLELQKPEAIVLAVILQGHAEWESVASHLSPEDFSPPYRPIARALASAEKGSTVSAWIAELEEEEQSLTSGLAMSDVFANPEKALQDALGKLVNRPRVEERLKALRDEIRRTTEVGDRSRTDELQRAYRALVAEKLARRETSGTR